MYPTRIRVSEATAARRRVPIWLVDVVDGLTAETGINGKPNLSILGAAPAGTTNNIVEINLGGMPGLYYIELTALEVATLGTSFLSFKTATTAQWHGSFEVWDPNEIAIPTSDQVWDELGAGHVAAGSFGAIVQAVPAAVVIAAAVWDILGAAHTTQGSFGETVQDTNDVVEHLGEQGSRG